MVSPRKPYQRVLVGGVKSLRFKAVMLASMRSLLAKESSFSTKENVAEVENPKPFASPYMIVLYDNRLHDVI